MGATATPEPCPYCDGSGIDDGTMCKPCNGTGTKGDPCDVCNGHGWVCGSSDGNTEPCVDCNGEGWIAPEK